MLGKNVFRVGIVLLAVGGDCHGKTQGFLVGDDCVGTKGEADGGDGGWAAVREVELHLRDLRLEIVESGVVHLANGQDAAVGGYLRLPLRVADVDDRRKIHGVFRRSGVGPEDDFGYNRELSMRKVVFVLYIFDDVGCFLDHRDG